MEERGGIAGAEETGRGAGSQDRPFAQKRGQQRSETGRNGRSRCDNRSRCALTGGAKKGTVFREESYRLERNTGG